PCKTHTPPISPRMLPRLRVTPATPHTVCSASYPQSGRRYRSLRCRTTRLRNSFIHQAVRKLNSLPSLPPALTVSLIRRCNTPPSPPTPPHAPPPLPLT